MTKEGGAGRRLEGSRAGGAWQDQATAMMMAHGGADGGRSHGGVMAADSMGPTNGGGAGGGGARGGDGEPTSQGDAEDPGGGRVEPRALATKAKVELRRSAAEPE